MAEADIQKCVFLSEDSNEVIQVQGEITGQSEIDYHDDLKLKAVIALLNSVDQVNFNKVDKNDVFTSYMSEIELLLDAMKEHERFQGEIK